MVKSQQNRIELVTRPGQRQVPGAGLTSGPQVPGGGGRGRGLGPGKRLHHELREVALHSGSCLGRIWLGNSEVRGERLQEANIHPGWPQDHPSHPWPALPLAMALKQPGPWMQ